MDGTFNETRSILVSHTAADTPSSLTHDLNQIIHAAQRGDESALRQLIERHYAYVHRVAYNVLLNNDEAKDAAQETFIKVWQNITRFNPAMNFSTWLYRIVANTAIDHHRDRTRRAAARLDEPSAEVIEPRTPEATGYDELHEIVRRLLGHLPPLQRLIFALRDVEDLSVADVATVTGISPESVRTNLSYARKKLRELLATEYDIQGTRT